ncbi:MAG: mechanosensitive ion channel family protein [bacterium]
MEIEVIYILNFIKERIFSINYILQIIILFFLGLFSYYLSGSFKKHIYIEKIIKYLKHISIISREKIILEANKLLWPIIAAVLVWIYSIIAISLAWPYQIVISVAHILNAWIIIKIVSSFIHNRYLSHLISLIIWILAVLRILNIYDIIMNFLDDITLSTGNYSITVLASINSVLIFITILFLSGKIADFLEKKVSDINTLTPSARVLIKKFIRITLIIIAILLSLSNFGIDLTAFAFLGGTIGVGLGFGLQKVVSNFVSGIIILMDKSVKPGDVIEINDTYGYINNLDTRFVSLITRSGKEFLIPNEDFITQTVVNWSHSDKHVRIDVPVGISYESDLRKVIKLIEESVKGMERIKKDSPPKCRVVEFGDSSINLVLRIWISDPHNGITNIKSEVMLRIWDVFKENSIVIPYPQRDLHLIRNERTNISED